MTHSSLLSQSFDFHCTHCSDFIDILTFDPIPDDNPSFCGLLDHSSIGVYMFDASKEALVFDTGASVSISNTLSDFVSWDATSDVPALHGITTQAPVQGSGIVRWTVTDDNGRPHHIETDAYYVHAAKVRLLSPQRYLRQRKLGSFVLHPNSTIFYFDPQSPLTFTSLNKQHVGLPIASLHRRRDATWLDAAQLGTDVLEPVNANLNNAQKELLAWHYRLAHFNMPWIQQLSRPRKGSKDDVPLMQMRFPKVSSLDTTAIKCQACQLGKARRHLDNVTVERVREDRDGGLKKEILRVGSKVATDQFVSSVKGHRFDTKGKEPDGQRFTGGTIFVDISSGYMEVHPQVSLRAQDTIIRKQRFERNLNSFGHSVQMYLGDNGVYRSKEFMNDLKDRGKTIEFCGVGAHHQNDVTEQAVRTVSEAARNMMIHAAIHCALCTFVA